MKLNDEHLKFLRALQACGPTFRKGLPPADAAQRKARAQCNARGFAKYTRDGWVLLWQGKAVLREEDG